MHFGTLNSNKLGKCYICVTKNNCDVCSSGDGGWDSTNIEVAQKSHDGHITCHSFHLTCFVVLVDVSGELSGGQLYQVTGYMSVNIQAIVDHVDYHIMVVGKSRKYRSVNCNIHRLCSLNNLFTNCNSLSDHLQVCCKKCTIAIS